MEALARVIPMAAPAQVKGISFYNRHEFVLSRFGEQGLARLRATLPTEMVSVLEISSASSWYPLQSVVDLDLAIVKCFFDGDLKAARQIGFYNLDKAIHGVYRIVLRLFEVSTLMKKANAIWQKIVDQGELVVSDLPPNGILARLEHFTSPHRIYCEVVAGSFSGAVSACCGEEAAVEHTACIHDGARVCEYVIRW